MRDPISIPRLQLLHPKAIQTFKDFIEQSENQLNITLRIVQGLRNIDEQNNLYAQGRTQEQLNAVGLNNVVAQPNLPVVTNAYAWLSLHCYGLAVDLVRMNGTQPDWNYDNSQLAAIMPAGMEWGGNWIHIKDKPHFQFTFGNSVGQLMNKYKTGDATNGYVNV